MPSIYATESMEIPTQQIRTRSTLLEFNATNLLVLSEFRLLL